MNTEDARLYIDSQPIGAVIDVSSLTDNRWVRIMLTRHIVRTGKWNRCHAYIWERKS